MIDNVDQKIGMYSVIERFLLKKYNLTAQAQSSGHVLLTFKPEDGKEVSVIVAFSDKKPSNSKIFGKCLSWKLFAKDENRQGNLYYVFVYFDKQLIKHRFFIVPNNKVVGYLIYEHKYWLKSKSSHKDNPFRAFRLGLFYENYNNKVPMVYEYEDRWDLIKS